MREMRMKSAATAEMNKKRREPASLNRCLKACCYLCHGFAAKFVKLFVISDARLYRTHAS